MTDGAAPLPHQDQRQHHQKMAQEHQAAHRLSNLPNSDSNHEMLQSILKDLSELTTELRGIKAHLRVNDHNTAARIDNSRLSYRLDPLQPLHSVVTGLIIDDFPTNISAISDMGPDQMDTVLRHLGQDIDGDMPTKVAHLRYMIGLTAVPV